MHRRLVQLLLLVAAGDELVFASVRFAQQLPRPGIGGIDLQDLLQPLARLGVHAVIHVPVNELKPFFDLAFAAALFHLGHEDARFGILRIEFTDFLDFFERQ